MSEEKPFALAASSLRRSAEHAVAYLAGLADRRVAPAAADVEALQDLPDFLPDRPIPPGEVIDKLHAKGSPAAMGNAGGRFFGLVVGGALPAALGARVLASAWDQIVFDSNISPVGLRCEEIASRWLLDLLGLPADASVGFVTGATMANVTCLAAARHRLLERAGWPVEKKGLFGAPALRVVASAEGHVTVRKALSLLGIGTDAVETVPCDDNGAMQAAALPKLDARTIVVCQAGNVQSGAADPVGAVAQAAEAAGAWVHVDGAFGLWAAASPSTRPQLAGLEKAHSWVVDGHKWLNTPYDCGMAICRDNAAVHAAMATVAPYLTTGGKAAPKDMVPEFSRAARGVEVYAALASLGRQGVADLIDRCCAHARRFRDGLQDLGFEVMNRVVLNQVVATWPGAEDRMAELAAQVQRSGEAWFGATQWRGRAGFRISVASWATGDEDVARTLAAIANARDALGLKK